MSIELTCFWLVIRKLIARLCSLRFFSPVLIHCIRKDVFLIQEMRHSVKSLTGTNIKTEKGDINE